MGMSPMGQGLGSNVKSFWKKPDSIAGWVILAGLVATGAVFFQAVSSYVLGLLTDALHMAILGLELAGLAYLVFGKKPRLLFRLLSRKLTGLVIELDPIGILKDKLLQANKKRDELNQKIGVVSGQRRTLSDVQQKNKAKIQQDLAEAEEAKRRQADPRMDPASKLRMEYDLKLRMNDVARLQASNEKYADLFNTINTLYDRLTKLSAGVDFFIADMDGTIREEEIRYKTVNATYSAFSAAMSIIRGSAEDNDLYDQTTQFLADNASMKLGQIDDMMRLSQNYMDSIDLQTGASNTQAMAALDAYEQKLLTSGDQGSIALLTGGTNVPQKESVPVAGQAGYDSFFKK